MDHIGKARSLGNRIQRAIELRLEGLGKRRVDRASAARADHVMVMLRDALAQLILSELITSHHAANHTGVSEAGQVPINGALRETATTVQDLGERQRPAGARQYINQ